MSAIPPKHKPSRPLEWAVLLCLAALMSAESSVLATDFSRPPGVVIQEWELQVAAVRDAHASSLSVLETAPDLPAGFRGLSRDLDLLSRRLPEDKHLEKLTDEARKIAAEISRVLPEGRVSAEAAGDLDKESIDIGRRAGKLRLEIAAQQKDLLETGFQLQKWQNAYHAFDFDPRRQDHIVRRLVAARRAHLGEGEKLAQIPLDPALEIIPVILENRGDAIEESALGETPEVRMPQEIAAEEIRRPLPITEPIFTAPASLEDPLVSALEQVVTRPDDMEAQAALNAACFAHLEHLGPRLLADTFNEKDSLSEHLIAHLESAARYKAPAAQQLLGMMHLTGRGRGINYPRGVAYLREASARLKANPEEPYGPGVMPAQCQTILPGVGTALFWLAESLLLGLMEQQPEAAATCYQQAAKLGDPRALARIQQLSSTVPVSGKKSGAPHYNGLVELHQVELTALESRLISARGIPVEKKTASKVSNTEAPASEEESVLPFTGLELSAPDGSAPGVLVTNVLFGSPAHKAGLRRGDLIVEAGSLSTSTLDSFNRIVREFSAGESLPVRFLRPGERSRQAQISLGAIASVTDAVFAVLDPVPTPAAGNPDGIGFQIFKITPGSAPAAAGLRAGDIVVGANDRYLRHWNDFAAALNPPQGMTTLIVQRHSATGQPQLISVELLRR